MPRFLRTPKAQMLLIFVILLSVALPMAGGVGLLPNLAAAVIPALVIDGLWLSIESRHWRFPTSALLCALFVFGILGTSESWLVVAWTSSFAILGKRIVRTNREQVFNPAGLALVWAPIAFGSGESWWGALGDLPMLWVALLLVLGVYMTERLNKFPLVLTFLATYFVFFTLVALGNPQSVAVMFREPFLQAALFLAFFMLTDPPTSPNRYADQVWFGGLAALAAGAAQLMGAGQIFLLLGLLTSNAVLTVVRYWRRRSDAAARTVAAPHEQQTQPVDRRLEWR